MNLLLIGAPGAGKGTMSEKIIDKYDVVHVSTGDMLRAAVKNETPVGLKAQEYMNKGALVPDSIIHDIIVERLKQDDIKKGFLFDGYPRTEAQAIDLDEILDELGLKVDAVINLNVDEDILIKRITGRRSCSSCGKLFNIYFHAPKQEGVCDECGGELIQRKDDNEESLKTRLSEFHKNTKPVIEHYERKGIVKHLDGTKDSKEVFGEVDILLGEL